ncbi:MAG: hypothetical protein ACRDRS_15175 [Pseudonocardiaceae bacterium]
MRSAIRCVAAPLVAFAVLTAGASVASMAGIGEPHTVAAKTLLLSDSVYYMAPQPPGLSNDEKRAIADKEAGQRYDPRAYNSARQKMIQAEKYNKERNKQKRKK